MSYKKEESNFTHPLSKGWLLPYLFGLSDMFDGRWSYWLRTIDNQKPLDEAIPKIDFDEIPNQESKKNLEECIKYMQRKGFSAYDSWSSLIEWILWGFQSKIQSEFPVKINEDINWYWYQKFNLGLLMKYPTDYMAWGSCELANMSDNKIGYFPTPMSVCKMMAEMTISKADKTKTVCDPCIGTGSLLLCASNYSLRLFGNDISLDMVKMATLNAYVYIPWLAMPCDSQIDWGDYDSTNEIECTFQRMKIPEIQQTIILSTGKNDSHIQLELF